MYMMLFLFHKDYAWNELKFVVATADVAILHTACGRSTVTFNPTPLTIRTDRPFAWASTAGHHTFTVYLP